MSRRRKIIKISLSTPVLARTKCPFCLSLPNNYYAMLPPPSHQSPAVIKKLFDRYIKYELTFNPVPYLHSSPKNLTGLSEFSSGPLYQKFKVGLHKNVPCKEPIIKEVLSYNCERTVWLFNFNSITERYDLIMKKASKFFNQNFPG